jgi:transmembrane sensor
VSRDYNDIEDLIGKYFANEASPEERAWVDGWRSKSESNQKYFDQYKIIFSKAGSTTSGQRFDTDAAWNKVRGKLKERGPAKVVAMRGDSRISKAFLRLAASIVFLITAGFFTYRLLFPERDKVEVATVNTIVNDTLPDGTSITINKKSRLTYAFNPNKKAHVVKLRGEAYFTISQKKNKTFIVDAGGVLIRDIGTAFNVKAYPGRDTVEVYVESGEVILYSEENEGIHLKAGMKGLYRKSTKSYWIDQPEANIAVYKTRIFVFGDESLENVVKSINDVYEKRIVLAENLNACRLTVTFNDEDIDEIANVIAETLGLKIRESGNEIILEGKGCE